MKAAEFREMTIDELNHRIEELRIELFNLRFQKAKNLLDKADRIRLAKRDVARIMTIISEKEKVQ